MPHQAEEIVSANRNIGVNVGEMDAKDLRETTVSKEHRTLLKVTMENVETAGQLIEDLMGKEVAPRKDFIFNNAADIIVGN